MHAVHVISLNTKYLVVKLVLSRLKCTEIDFGQGSHPDPARGAYDAPPAPLVSWGGGHPLPIPLLDLISGSGWSESWQPYLHIISVHKCTTGFVPLVKDSRMTSAKNISPFNISLVGISQTPDRQKQKLGLHYLTLTLLEPNLLRLVLAKCRI